MVQKLVKIHENKEEERKEQYGILSAEVDDMKYVTIFHSYRREYDDGIRKIHESDVEVIDELYPGANEDVLEIQKVFKKCVNKAEDDEDLTSLWWSYTVEPGWAPKHLQALWDKDYEGVNELHNLIFEYAVEECGGDFTSLV